MKIIAICPSKYPDKLQKMVTSFQSTKSSAFTELIVNYDKDKTITEIFNKEFQENNDADFYMMLNDDIIFQTNLWDKVLANKGKISYGDDSIEGGLKCQFPMIDGDIVRALGWLQMPKLNKYCGDVVWRLIGEQCGILKYFHDVKIEHQWHESQVDREFLINDMGKFGEWLPWSFRDMARVKAVLNG